LFLFFNRPEFDRYARFHSWGSAREVFSWEDMCDIEIDLPSLQIQQKYVDVYNALSQNQKVYEKGLDDLKLTCDAYIERLRRELPSVEIGPYIQSYYEIDNGKQNIQRRGISIAKKFVVPKQEQNSARSSQIVRNGQFAYNTATTRNGETLSIAYCRDEDCAVPGIYQVFEVVDKQKLIPEYLFLWFCRTEFDRYTRWVSVGSAHEQFLLDDMKEVKIPIPEINVQQAIVNIFNTYYKRRMMAEKLKEQMKNICSILVKGALVEKII
jgi:type I restriction enzyme, S subunit